MRARPLSNWPGVCCASESPVMCTFDSCGHFLSLQSLSLFFWKQTAKCKKNVRTTVKWLQVVALQNTSRLKMRWLFLRLLSCQTIGFLEFLSPKFNSNYYYGRENQNNSALSIKSSINLNFAEDINFMSSVHF